MVIISIIGTAGRDKINTYTPELFNKMIITAKYMMRNLTNITLISGGAAWADHIAVCLYLEGFVSKLVLHLPCKWENNKIRYFDTGEFNWRTNPGGTSNYYHSNFSRIIGRNSLLDINKAIEKGAEIVIHDGFHLRNNPIANCDYMIAFTWSPTNIPAEGGTLDTWNKCLFKSEGGTTLGKYHISLKIF